MTNPNNFPNIEGSELVSQSWTKLLERDASVKKQFAASEFPEVTADDIGTPCYREDEQKWYIFTGMGELDTPLWWCPFDDIKAQNVSFEHTGVNFPSTITNVDGALTFLSEKELPNAIIFPAESTEYSADGTTVEYPLQKVTSQASTVQVFFSGVKQSPSSYSLGSGGKSVLFNEPPAYGETILIQENASILEYDLMPIEASFVADNETTFLMPTDVVDVRTIQVNVDGKVLQHSEYTINGRNVILNEPVTGNVQITTIYKGRVNAPSIDTVGEYEIIDRSITEPKMAENSIGESSIKNAAVSTGKIANYSVTEGKLADEAVSTIKIADGAITLDKLAEIVESKLLGASRIDGSMLQDGIVNTSKLGQDVIDSIAEASANVSDATTDMKGVVKLATADEVINKTGSTNVITSEVLNELIEEDVLGGGNEDNVAKLDENNTFTGSNTFTKNIIYDVPNAYMIFKDSGSEAEVIPETTRYPLRFIAKDKNNKEMGFIEVHHDISGYNYVQLIASNFNEDGARITDKIYVGIKSDGTVTTRAPTPPASDNSRQIATTAWVNNRITNYGIPDWTAGVAKTLATEYTAETDGMLLIQTTASTTGRSVTIDGKSFSLINNAGSCSLYFTYFVSKGSVYKLTGTSGTYEFYPLKGVN